MFPGFPEVNRSKRFVRLIYTSTSVFNPPPGLAEARVRQQACGGGGAGGRIKNVSYGAGGGGAGGAGEYIDRIITLTESSYPITIGTAGTAGAGGVTPTDGGDGGDVSFGSFIALGGDGGKTPLGGTNTAGVKGFGGTSTRSPGTTMYYFNEYLSGGDGGDGGIGANTSVQADPGIAGTSVSYNSSHYLNSSTAKGSGGAPGGKFTGLTDGGGGGGGGASALGNGGAGGKGGQYGGVGAAAATSGSGYGYGGGGGGGGAKNANPAAGSEGGPGIIMVEYWI